MTTITNPAGSEGDMYLPYQGVTLAPGESWSDGSDGELPPAVSAPDPTPAPAPAPEPVAEPVAEPQPEVATEDAPHPADSQE